MSFINWTTSRLKRPWSISFQLLLIVNVTLGAAIIALLLFRYWNEIQTESHKRYLSLNDEAIAIHGAVNHLQHGHDMSEVQSYIDTVCRQMRNETTLCHHIAIKVDGQLLQAQSHEMESPELFSAISRAAIAKTHRSQGGTHKLVAASHAGNGITVYVSENLDTVQQAIRLEVISQLIVLGLLGFLAAGIVNVVLLRVVGVPLHELMHTVDRIAAGNLGVVAPSFQSQEMDRLSKAITSMSLSLQKNDRERHLQMEKAQQIQEHLLPGSVSIPGLQMAHLFRPADIVAGDYYDFISLPDGTWLICLADVTGHGIPAAMGATMLKSLLLAATEEPPFDPVSIITEINRRFVQTVLPGNFASMFLAQWNPITCDLSWASAGHEPGILLKPNGESEILDSTGLLLGITTDAIWTERNRLLKAEEQVLLFSDGANETRDWEQTIFGRERLITALRECSGKIAVDTLNQIEHILSNFRSPQSLQDDLTLVLFKVRSASTEHQT